MGTSFCRINHDNSSQTKDFLGWKWRAVSCWHFECTFGPIKDNCARGVVSSGHPSFPWKEGSDEAGDGVVVDDSGIILGLRLLDGAERK